MDIDMDMNMASESEENIYYNHSYTECQEENEYPPEMYYSPNQSLVHQDAQMIEHFEETQPMQQETQAIQSLHKLNNIDTEASIKTEIKQLISTKISEEINSKILDDTTYEVEEQISNLKTKTDTLQNKIHELDMEVESDANRLAQSELTLQQTAEVIALLKENVEKLSVRNRESRINEISEKSLQQRKNFESLKKIYGGKIEQETEYFENMKTSFTDRKKTLQLELTRQTELLTSLKQRQEELKKATQTCDDEIERKITKKLALENKLASITNKRITIKNEFVEQHDILNNLILENENRLEKFSIMNKEQQRLEEQLELETGDMDDIKTRLVQKEDQILETEKTLSTLRNCLETMKNQYQETFNQLQEDYTSISEKLKEKETILATCDSYNDQLRTDLTELNNTYIQKCEKKLEWININLEQQNAVHTVKLELLKKHMEVEIKRSKLEDLENRHETTRAVLNALENDIEKEREAVSNESTQIKLKFEVAQADYNKYFLELRKKKEYLLVNSKFLEEKSENLRQEVNTYEKSLQTMHEDNASVKLLIESKLKQVEECKNNLNALKMSQGSEIPLKSGFRSPKSDAVAKKVQFNEILSFKSRSSSELSNVPGETATQLETSFPNWPEDTKTPSDVEVIDEEC